MIQSVLIKLKDIIVLRQVTWRALLSWKLLRPSKHYKFLRQQLSDFLFFRPGDSLSEHSFANIHDK